MAETTALDQLYALPLDDFTAARNELASRLRKAGERAAADEVKRLQKPSITAWALNQVSHSEPKLVEQLLTAAQDLGRAQQQLLVGRDRAGFREASQEERKAVTALVRAAAEVLAKDAHPAGKAALDRLEATARAAAADPDSGELLRRGRLSRDLDPSGFGGLAPDAFGLGAEPIPFPTQPKQAPERSAKAEAEDKAEPADDRLEKRSRAREVVRELQQQLVVLRKQASDAERVTASARHAAVRADRELTAARDAAARAEKEAEQARRVEHEAADDLASLRSRIDETSEALEAAEDELKSLRN